MKHDIAADTDRGTLSDALSRLVRLLAKAISEARNVRDVTCALQALRSLLWLHRLEKNDYDAATLEIAEQVSSCQEKALQISSGGDWRSLLRSIFYQGLSFPLWAKVLLFSVAPDWLACFSTTEQAYLFDAFFMQAPPIVLIKELVCALAPTYQETPISVETTLSCRTVERLLTDYLCDADGIRQVVMTLSETSEHSISEVGLSITALAQYVASIPDKARREAPCALLLPKFHLSATLSALQAAEIHWELLCKSSDVDTRPLVFTAELCTRFCRRGHADIVASQILVKILHDAKHSDLDNTTDGLDFGKISGYWIAIMDYMKDIHALERLVRELLLEMSKKQIKDTDAYSILCLLFSKLIKRQNNVRLLFTEKVIYWTNLSFCCTRWMMFFIVFNREPTQATSKSYARFGLDGPQLEIIKTFAGIWAEEKFIQAADVQKQSHITAAICLSLSIMTKENLENSQNLMQQLLQGVGRRLESPLHLVRLTAKKVALAFSLLVDPTNPLLLDEDDKVEDLAEWDAFDDDESRKITSENRIENEPEDRSKLNRASDMVRGTKKVDGHQDAREAYDPDEVIDLQTYRFSDNDSSDKSDSESDCSLQPYDLSDDESDLVKDKFPAQLTDCATNLRKGDDPDAVEKALEVVQKLVRALPEELENVAPDLANALIHVRCSDIAIEGQEQSAEKKRHDALVALLACTPSTVEVFTKTFYSPHVDISQRLLILEVMSDAARELAASGSGFKALSSKSGSVQRIMEIDKTWYGPGSWLLMGASPWKEVFEPTPRVSLIHKYERELPQRQESSQNLGTSRRWGHRSLQLRRAQTGHHSSRINNFVAYAPSFMLPVMRDYDKRQHGVDLIGRDFIVLGRLICMLGVCMECVSLQPEACVLAVCLLSMLRTKHISGHPEAYVRRATLYAISRVMISLHPSHVKDASSGGNAELASSLVWIRSWAIEVAENDNDQECSSMAVACLHLHSELFMQAARVADMKNSVGGNASSVKYKESQLISLVQD